MTLRIRGLATLATALALSGCAATRPDEIEWRPIVCFEARNAIERVRCGRPDPEDPALQAVSVDQAGDVALIHFRDGVPRAEVVYRHGSELTGIVLADIDRQTDGEELYASGSARGAAENGEGGAVLQILIGREGPGRVRVRRIFEGPAYVHSIERVDPQRAGDVARILASTYDGEIHLLTPTPGAGPWDDRLLHREPISADPESPKAKDAALLIDPAGRAPHAALVAYKTGRLVLLDLDRPEEAHLVHDEAGGLSRITRDPDGGAYVTGYAGRVLHWRRTPDGSRVDVIEQEGVDSGLRGLVLGEFPIPHGTAHMVVFGFHKLVRALVPRYGVLDPLTIHVDLDRGHAIEAGDVVPGNGADEILVGGYSKRVTLLVAGRARDRAP